MSAEHAHTEHALARHTHAETAPPTPHSAAEWDAQYSSADRIWTAEVNPALVAETADLPAGTALDVGSGEGADARWLAERGWQVTALDISQVAVDRARRIGPHWGISWLRSDLRTDDVPGIDFGLVAMHYFPITTDHTDVARKLVAAVGPGGTLLVVGHAPEGMRAHGFNPDDYVQPQDFLGLLGDGWEVVTDETRERGRPAGRGQHVNDTVVRVRRLR